MPSYHVPLRELQFVLNEVLDFPSHFQAVPGGEEATPELVDSIIEECARFAEQVVAPLNPVGDQVGCRWEDGTVTTPPGYREAYQQFVEAGWPSLARPTEHGGQGLPASLGYVVNEMLGSACHAWLMYPSLSQGCMTTIEHWGTDEQKQTYLPEMVTGNWTGTMCLTEAHCGSDLGLLRCRAEPQDDGSYQISGTKIFISSGEHELSDNIIHMVLARLPDAPEGTRGISLFIVPKFLVGDDGTPGERNGVTCGSIEEKMGIHGNATCVLNFDRATGYLIGPANRGLNCMFTFINESRLGVGQQGLDHIEVAFQGSLAYARDRLQMRGVERMRPDLPADPIIVHPDVRRMLLTQKSLAEGGRLFIYYCAKIMDYEVNGASEEIRGEANRKLALLTPIAKGFLTEMGVECAHHGIQIFGGHGYIAEHGMEQIARDVRITALYEGTTGIQAVDLLGRKLYGSDGQLLTWFTDEIKQFCTDAGPVDGMTEFVSSLRQHSEDWEMLTREVIESAANDANNVGAAAFDYLMLSGYVTVAYFLACSARVALEKIAAGGGETSYYQSKVHTAEFYFRRILPRTSAHTHAIRAGASCLMDLPADDFGPMP